MTNTQVHPIYLTLPRFSVTWGPLDKRRPCVVVSEPASAELTGIACVALITSRKGRAPIGSVEISRDDADNLYFDSHITHALWQVEVNSCAAPGGTLPPHAQAELVRHLSALVSTHVRGTSAYYDTFLRYLKPPSLRHIGAPHLARIYDLLRLNGWVSPRQGDVLEAPDWHTKLGGLRFVVISNTEYNTRSRLPGLVLAPMCRSAATGRTSEEWRAEGRIVVADEKGDCWVFIEEGVFTFDPSKSWLAECKRCFHAMLSNGFWKLQDGRCASCDGARVDFPTRVDGLSNHQLDSALKRVRRYLGLE